MMKIPIFAREFNVKYWPEFILSQTTRHIFPQQSKTWEKSKVLEATTQITLDKLQKCLMHSSCTEKKTEKVCSRKIR